MRAFLFSIAFLAAVPVFAQVDFSGKWVINKTKTEFGQAPEWVVPKDITVEQQKDKFVIDRDWLDDAGASHQVKEEPLFDGSEANSISYSGKKVVSTVKWSDDRKAFTEHALSSTADGQPWADITETWTLSDDGTELLISRDVEQKNDGLKYTIKVYYTKQ